jgi:hypothetical protein
VSPAKGLSEPEQLVGALDQMESELEAITVWLPSEDIRVRRLLQDARTALSAACWVTVRAGSCEGRKPRRLACTPFPGCSPRPHRRWPARCKRFRKPLATLWPARIRAMGAGGERSAVDAVAAVADVEHQDDQIVFVDLV